MQLQDQLHEVPRTAVRTWLQVARLPGDPADFAAQVARRLPSSVDRTLLDELGRATDPEEGGAMAKRLNGEITLDTRDAKPAWLAISAVNGSYTPGATTMGFRLRRERRVSVSAMVTSQSHRLASALY